MKEEKYYKDKTITIVGLGEVGEGAALLTFNHPGPITEQEEHIARTVTRYLFPDGLVSEEVKATIETESHESWHIMGKYMGGYK